MNENEENLEIPIIYRARNYRLYDKTGNRLIDMYQNNGHTILGHKAFKLTTVLKNAISRGLISDLPSIYAKRLENYLKTFFHDFKSIRVYSSFDKIIKAASIYSNRPIEASQIADPTHNTAKQCLISYWRPFLTNETEAVTRNCEMLIPILPFSVGDMPQVICFKKETTQSIESSSIISPFILSGIIRSLYDLKKYKNNCCELPQHLELSYWHKENIYLSAYFDKIHYKKIYSEFLNAGILISPVYPGPIIIPAELSLGEQEKIQKLFKRTQELLNAN